MACRISMSRDKALNGREGGERRSTGNKGIEKIDEGKEEGGGWRRKEDNGKEGESERKRRGEKEVKKSRWRRRKRRTSKRKRTRSRSRAR